ncbi:MAG: acyl carrier protein [Gammaproteobacteria bacterium GWF2_41_13]|nr:MAG: acyl carrier protein [Gammaproteobacteria bacterium GWF2_41_13]
MKDKITAIVVESVEELNATLDNEVDTTFAEKALLYGGNGMLDSIALVSLIVIVEEKIQDELGVDIILANEKAMSQRHSPFLTIGTLSNYIKTLVEKEPHD